MQTGTHVYITEITSLKQGITLIEVPYWWDRRRESLAATIHKVAPELVPNPPGAEPIPTSCPFRKNDTPSIAPISHGYPWDGFQDISGW